MTDILERARAADNRDMHLDVLIDEMADEIERLRHENDAFRNGLDGADRLSNALAEKACRRGARMQKMKEWMQSGYELMGPQAWPVWDAFVDDKPEAAKWFDEDGVPR